MLKYFVGIDSGTSVIKAVVFSQDGKELGMHGIPIPIVEQNENWFEQDMNLLWEYTKECILKAIIKAKVQAKDIIGIGITAQGAGTWMIDKKGEPTRPGICWCDGRSVDIAEELHKNGIAEKVYDLCGNAVYSGSQAVQMLWLEKNEPETIEKATTIFHVKDWIFFKLTGIRSSDTTDESLPFLDMGNRKYERKSFELHGLEKYFDKKPTVLEPLDNKGFLINELVNELGMSEEVIVTSGPMDCSACPLGVGVIEPGQVCSTIGTAGIHVLAMDKVNFNPRMVAGNLTHAPENRWLRLLDAISATPSLTWFIDNFAYEDKEKAKQLGIDLFEYLDKKISDIPSGSLGLIFHPYLAPAGERAPFINGNAKGSFFGLSYKHSRYHMLRAVYEGVAFATLDCYKHFPMEIKEIRLAGGGAKSPVWCQMFADMAGIPVKVPEGSEFGAKGAVMVTGIVAGMYKDYYDAIEKTVKINKIYYPNIETHKIYNEYYQFYLDLRKNFESCWNERAKLLKSTN